MDTQKSAVRTYFEKLGLGTELADIYLALHSFGPQSISELSRNSKVERTRIYRLIDKLMESGLIELEPHAKRGIIKAAAIGNLRIVIQQREEALRNLQDELGLVEQVLARNSLSNPAMRVQLYYGPEGIRHMMRNKLRAKSEILSYARHIPEEIVGKAFMNRWIDDFETAELSSRILINSGFTKSLQAGKRSHIATQRTIKGTEIAVVPDEVHNIHEQTDIFDETVAYQTSKDGEVFGVELYNRSIADSQRQFFELIWERVRPGQA